MSHKRKFKKKKKSVFVSLLSCKFAFTASRLRDKNIVQIVQIRCSLLVPSSRNEAAAWRRNNICCQFAFSNNTVTKVTKTAPNVRYSG